jgi:hypothetical protein
MPNYTVVLPQLPSRVRLEAHITLPNFIPITITVFRFNILPQLEPRFIEELKKKITSFFTFHLQLII